MYKNEKIYIAGPECFYTGGREQLDVMRRRAESLGFGVTLPNDHPLDMGNPDLQKRADSIFADLKTIMKETTIIIADLEAYRGSEADSGTIYEIGMAYADGIRCYGYTRDKRTLSWKDQKYVLRDGVVYDEKGEPAPYRNLPFSPAVVGSTKIIEGDFDDCLHMVMNDLEEERKQRGKNWSASCADAAVQHGCQMGQEHTVCGKRPRIYLADIARYKADAADIYNERRKQCEALGLEAVTPLDWADGMAEPADVDPYVRAGALAENYRRLIESCDAVLTDLNDFRGYECANDVGFECGVGFEYGKKLFGYMEDTRPCIEKLPHFGEAAEYRDMAGCNVENFNYPINLMFASSMKISKGGFAEALEAAAKALLK